MARGDGEPAVFLFESDAVVVVFFRVSPAMPRIMDSAMEKQLACAAPMSSSGFVPGSPSKRVRNE